MMGPGTWCLRTAVTTIVTWDGVRAVPALPSQVRNPLRGGLRAHVPRGGQRQLRVIEHVPGAVLCTLWHGWYIPVPWQDARSYVLISFPFHRWRISDLGTWPARQLVKMKPDLAPKVKGCWVQERPLWLVRQRGICGLAEDGQQGD